MRANLFSLAAFFIMLQSVSAQAQETLIPPSLLEYVRADYPQEAFDSGVEGVVTAQIDVDENGLVTHVEITEAAGHGFDEVAVDAMYGFVFSPATKDGEPIPASMMRGVSGK